MRIPGSLGDNQVPMGVVNGAWENPATMNDTWVFKIEGHNWKSTTTLLHLLAELTGKGVNYLLNIGPTPEGDIIDPAKVVCSALLNAASVAAMVLTVEALVAELPPEPPPDTHS